MPVLVKICGMTDEAAIEAAVSAGADAVGFVFADASPRNLSIARAASLLKLVPDDVRRVVVTLHPAPEFWRAIQRELKPDVLQTDAEDLEGLAIDQHVDTWPVFRQGKADDGEIVAETFVYEGMKSGAGETVDWHQAAAIAKDRNMILAGGLSAENVGEAIRVVAPWGVDVSSAVESSPGVKDPKKIADFVAAVRAADKG